MEILPGVHWIKGVTGCNSWLVTDSGGFIVIDTPGHTPGSLCLWQPEKLLFAGDAVRTHAAGKLLTPSKPTAVDLKKAMDSIVK